MQRRDGARERLAGRVGRRGRERALARGGRRAVGRARASPVPTTDAEPRGRRPVERDRAATGTPAAAALTRIAAASRGAAARDFAALHVERHRRPPRSTWLLRSGRSRTRSARASTSATVATPSAASGARGRRAPVGLTARLRRGGSRGVSFARSGSGTCGAPTLDAGDARSIVAHPGARLRERAAEVRAQDREAEARRRHRSRSVSASAASPGAASVGPDAPFARSSAREVDRT